MVAESQKLAAQQLVHIMDLINQTVTVVEDAIVYHEYNVESISNVYNVVGRKYYKLTTDGRPERPTGTIELLSLSKKMDGKSLLCR